MVTRGSGDSSGNQVAARQDWQPWHIGADEETHAATRDGWFLPVYRFRPHGVAIEALPPVLLCHGLGANRFNLAAVGKANLARWLAARGREVFVVELRGAGRSVELTPHARTSSAWRYNFDSYVHDDVPALLGKIREVTGSEEIDWVGHSMGATVLYALAGYFRGASGGVRIRRGVAIAGPGCISELPASLRLILNICTRLPIERLPNRAWLRVLGGFFPEFTPENEPSLGLKANYDRDFGRQLIRNVGSDFSRSLLLQVKSWSGRGAVYSANGSVNYTAALAESRVPIRFIRPGHDILVAPDAVEAAWRAAGGPKDLVVVGKAQGFRSDYGHSDIVLGRHAEHDVYPLVEAWLDQGRGTTPELAEIRESSSDIKL